MNGWYNSGWTETANCVCNDHTDESMNGWMGGGIWFWNVIGVLVVVLLVVLIIKLSRK